MMIRPAAASVLLLLGVLATAAAADAVPDAAVKEEGRGLRGLVNKIVSPLTDQLVVRKKPGIKDDPALDPAKYNPTMPSPYNPTRPIDPEKYNPTMPPLDDPNGGRNLRGLVNKIASPLKNIGYQPTTTIIDPVKVPDYNPTRPRTDTHARTDQYTDPFPSPEYEPVYDPTRPTKTTSF